MRSVKVWTTIDSGLKRDLKALTVELGFRTETECLREALRQGIQALKAQRSVFRLEKRKDSILKSAGLLEQEYDGLGRGELELKIKSQWKTVEEQPA